MMTIHGAVLFFAFVGVSFALKTAEEYLKPEHKKCVEESGIELQDVLNSVDDNYMTTEGNAKINEYTECFFKKLNLVDENGEINSDALKSIFTPFVEHLNNKVVDIDQASSAAVDFCKSVTGDSLGDRFVKIDNCLVRYIQQN